MTGVGFQSFFARIKKNIHNVFALPPKCSLVTQIKKAINQNKNNQKENVQNNGILKGVISALKLSNEDNIASLRWFIVCCHSDIAFLPKEMTYDQSVTMEGNYIIGTCQTMCPTKEAKLREKENLLHKFEIKKGTECNPRPEYDPNKTVKSFSRSAAGVEKTNPSNLRPFSVLQKTIKYLYAEIFPLHKNNPTVVYNFMFDRLRAVRQDAVIQNLSSTETIQILEPIVRFLIYFGYILVEEDISEFDPHINNIHLQECMKRLLVCYSEAENISLQSRWEIESAYLLFNLGSIKPLTRGFNICKLQQNKNYLYCLELSFQWYLKNYFKVFKMILDLPPLLLCVINYSIPEVRKHSLQALCFAFSSVNSSYPVSRLQRLMLFESKSQVIDECQHFNIKTSIENINFLKKDFNFSAKCKPAVRLKLIDKKLSECDLIKLLYS